MAVPYDLTTVTGSGSPVVSSAGKFGNGLSGGGVGIGLATASLQPDFFLQNGVIANDSTGGAMGSGTIECWVKRATTPGALEIFLGHDRFFWLGCSTDGKPTLHYGAGGVSELVVTTTTNICDNVFHHVAVDWNAGKPTIYVDGVATGSSASTQAVGTSSFGFTAGMYSNVTTFNWGGVLDEVRLTNTRLYTTGFTPPAAKFPVASSGLVALYRFDTGFLDAARQIAPDDANTLYSPFGWDTTNDRSLTINSGQYFRVAFSGAPTAVALCFDVVGVLTPTPEVTIKVDGAFLQTTAIASRLAIASGFSAAWPVHVLEVIVKSTTETQNRWSGAATAVKYTGLAMSGGSGYASVAESRRALNVLCYGDSITEGVRTINSSAGNDTDRNDALSSWAYLLRDVLGCEVGVVGFGGSGLSVTGSGAVPILGTSYNLLYSGGPARSFSAPVPDAILLNEGTNDGSTDITSAYTTVLNALLAATPATTVILAMRPFSGNRDANIIAAVAACTAPSRVTHVDTTGWFSSGDSSDGTHPYGYTNIIRIAQLAGAAVRAALATRGPLFFKNAGGAAATLTPYRA